MAEQLTDEDIEVIWDALQIAMARSRNYYVHPIPYSREKALPHAFSVITKMRCNIQNRQKRERKERGE